MVSYSDISVRSSLENVQNLVQQAFAGNGFEVKWENEKKGVAEKGSRAGNLLLGALAQYYKVDFEIYPGQGGAVLRLIKGNSGLAGGVIGMSRVNKQFKGVSETLASWFQQQGVLQNVKTE